MKRVVITILFCVTAFCGLVRAAAGQDASLDANKQRWESMNKEERAKIISAYRNWKSLDAAKQSEIKKRYEQFRGLPDETKASVAINVERFKQMPGEKKQIVRNYLHAGPDRWASQLCFMRIVASMQEAGQQVDRKEVSQKFVEWQGKYLDEEVYPDLSEEERAQIDGITDKTARYRALIEAAKEKVREDPPEYLADDESPSYEIRLQYEVMCRSCEWIAAQLPAGMPEMAFFIRTRAMSAFPRGKLMEIMSAPPEQVQLKVQALAQSEEMKGIIAAMPAEARARYEAFDDQKKMKVLAMAFKPMVEVGPQMPQRHFGPRGPIAPHPQGQGATQPGGQSPRTPHRGEHDDD
jgi:hypothetical protein